MSSSYRLWLCRWSKKPGASGKKCLGLKKCCMQGTWQVNYRWMLERWEIGNRLCEKNKIISVTIMSLSLSHLSADEFPEWFMLRERFFHSPETFLSMNWYELLFYDLNVKWMILNLGESHKSRFKTVRVSQRTCIQLRNVSVCLLKFIEWVLHPKIKIFIDFMHWNFKFIFLTANKSKFSKTIGNDFNASKFQHNAK